MEEIRAIPEFAKHLIISKAQIYYLVSRQELPHITVLDIASCWMKFKNRDYSTTLKKLEEVLYGHTNG